MLIFTLVSLTSIKPTLYKIVHTGTYPGWMQKRIDKTDDEGKKAMLEAFSAMFGVGKGGLPWVTRTSVANQFYSDLVIKVQHEELFCCHKEQWVKEV